MSLLEEEQQEQIDLQMAQEKAEVFDEDKTPTPATSTAGSVDIGLNRPSFTPGRTSKTPEELAKQQEVDSRSVYVGNVDYKTTPDELETLFHVCGTINRITILFDKFTGFPKGYAYVEFEEKEAVPKAVVELNSTDFKGRTISVVEKRTNLPGFRRSRGRGRGSGRFASRGIRGRVGGVKRDANPKDFELPALQKLELE